MSAPATTSISGIVAIAEVWVPGDAVPRTGSDAGWAGSAPIQDRPMIAAR